MACNVPPFAAAVLREATRLSPSRRTSSDGVCADARHYATGGDHVPSGPHSYAHAVDISQSMPGAPYFEARHGKFDAHMWARVKAQAFVEGHGDDRIEYMVIGQPDGPDIIFNPSVSLTWRQNGSYKTDHRSHLHVSFTVAAEQSTAPFFGAAEDDDVNDQDKIDIANQAGVVASREVLKRLPALVRQACEEAIAGKFSTVHQDGTEVPNGLIFKLRTFFK